MWFVKKKKHSCHYNIHKHICKIYNRRKQTTKQKNNLENDKYTIWFNSQMVNTKPTIIILIIWFKTLLQP